MTHTIDNKVQKTNREPFSKLVSPVHAFKEGIRDYKQTGKITSIVLGSVNAVLIPAAALSFGATFAGGTIQLYEHSKPARDAFKQIVEYIF